jgi:hypothetical protein
LQEQVGKLKFQNGSLNEKCKEFADQLEKKKRELAVLKRASVRRSVTSSAQASSSGARENLPPVIEVQPAPTIKQSADDMQLSIKQDPNLLELAKKYKSRFATCFAKLLALKCLLEWSSPKNKFSS